MFPVFELLKWVILIGALLFIGFNVSDQHLDNLASTISDMPSMLLIIILSLVAAILLKALFKSTKAE